MSPNPRNLNLAAWTVAVGVLVPITLLAADTPPFLERSTPNAIRILCYNVNWDSIFPDDHPDNHRYRKYHTGDKFRRIVAAVSPDIVCLQEIGWDHDPQDVGDILDDVIPLGSGQSWRTHRGSDNIIASRYDLSMTRTDTVPPTNRGQAMALIDLPDDTCRTDLYLINAHFKAGGGNSNISRRQQHSDAIVHWLGDLMTPGDHIDLPDGTPVIVLGDLNAYHTDPKHHVTTLVTGDIADEAAYGPDIMPDWDGSPLADALPVHNAAGADDYTWRNDGGSFAPGALDRIIYTDSVISIDHSFVLNTVSMTDADRAAAGLEPADVALDLPSGYYDHLPLVVDVRVAANPAGDFDHDGHINLVDFANLCLCLTGSVGTPGYQPPAAGCEDSFDFDRDHDVDLSDFTSFPPARP